MATSPLGSFMKHPNTINTAPNQVGMLKFPANLSNDPALVNYVGFYINVPDGTTTTQANENNLGYIPNDGQTGVDSANAHTGVINAAIVVGAAAAGASVGLSLIKKATSFGVGGGFVKKLAVPIVGAIAGAAVGAAAVESGAFKSNQYQRISGCIMLGLHNVPSFSSGANWGDTDLGTAGGMLAGGSSADMSSGMPVGDTLKLMTRNAMKLPGGSKAFNDKLSTAGTLLGGLNVGGVTSAITKEITNPFREQLFQKMNFREFSYTYHFMPSSKEEAKTVRDIIKTFRFHMHPDLSTSGIFFKFPSQFEIVYYFNGSENTNMSKLATCVLMNVDVQYGGNGVNFATFDDGMPVETTMTLHFRETEVLTKARINDGY